MSSLRLGGLATGLDTEALIQKILDASRAPIRRLESQKKILGVQSDAVTAIKSSLATLQTVISDLKDPLFFDSNIASSSDATVGTATASTSTVRGLYALNVTKLASATTLRSGTTAIGTPVPTAQKVAHAVDPKLNTAPTALLQDSDVFGAALNLGDFTIDAGGGAQVVTLDGSDTVDSALAKIVAADPVNIVSAAYSSSTDKITITSSGGPITLTAGTSNFLARARLSSGGASVASDRSLGTMVSALSSNSSYGSSLTVGTFTINGNTVTIDANDKLDDPDDAANSVFAKISTATGGTVTGTYSAVNDTITLTSGSPIVLGGGADTSDFLSRSRLYTNGTGSVSSLTSIGTIDTEQAIGSAASRIGTTITGGSFTVNGVSISVNVNDDTLDEVLDRITASDAGVYASYDSIEDRVILTSKTTGSIGITVADVAGNFASNMKLTSGSSLQDTGDDTEFTINGGVSRRSTDATISGAESGIGGLTISALKVGATNITVGSDTSKITSKITEFVSQYNSLQSIISSYTVTPTEDTKPEDSASILSGDTLVGSLPNRLRRDVTASLGTGTIQMLEDMGVTSSGSNNLLTVEDSAALSSALLEHPDEVESLFSEIMGNLDATIDTHTDAVSGLLSTRLTNIDDEEERIDDNIESQESRLLQEEERLVAAFSALEQAQAKSANVLTFLQPRKS